MKCLMKYQWVKLPRNRLPEGKGLMGYWAKLASRAAFRKGQASYCGYSNAVSPGMWSGGVVGLKSILGVKSRSKALETLQTLSELGYIEYTLDTKTKKLTYQVTDWVVKCSGEACMDGSVYATEGYGFLCLPRSITERLAAKQYKFEESDAWLDLWCHTVFEETNNAFSFLAPSVQYGKYGAVLTLEALGQRWGWEKTKVWRFFQKHGDVFALYRLPGSYGCLIFNRLYPTGTEVSMPTQEDIVNGYISDVQKSTMTSYPITISSQSVDMSGIMGTRGGRRENEVSAEENRTRVYADYSAIESSEEMASNIKENNLTAFKEYLDNPESEIHQYLGENGVVYSYGAHFGIYSYDADGNLVASDADIDQVSASTLSSEDSAAGGGPMANMERMNQVMSGSSDAGAENFSELMPSADGKAVSKILLDSYDLLYGSWPENYNEVVLVLNENNSIPAGTLYQLGLITGEEHKEITEQIKNGEDAEERIWNYEEICGHTFYMVLPCDQYKENEDGMFTYIGDDVMQIESLLENSVNLKITGIIRPVKDAENASIPTSVAYTVALTDYVIEHTDESAVILAQEKTPEVNVLNGIEFKAPDDEAKAADAVIYMSNLGISDKAAMYANILAHQETDESEEQEHIEAMQGAPSMSPSEMAAMEGVERTEEDEIAMARALDEWLGNNPDQETLVSAYDIFIAGPTYEENMKKFGKVSYDAPSSISIYTDSFEDKEAVSDCIDRYNEGVEKKEQITYTDYVALLTSSITSIVDVISYVLIAFVAVSLIVSSIMIGIITHISVLERIKEIGILRAIGASKRNISQVFNAETVIVGLLAGILGVGVSVLLTIPITSVIQNLLGASEISASLPVTAALLLILLSVAITVIAGWIPSRRAAKKDPVAALRTE